MAAPTGHLSVFSGRTHRKEGVESAAIDLSGYNPCFFVLWFQL